ncbi:MAG: hypothetical protein ACT4QF_11475 [Sporichthyaceae bacterium]
MRRTVLGMTIVGILAGVPFAGAAEAAGADRTTPVVRSVSTGKEVYALKPKVSQDVAVSMRVTDNVGVDAVYAKLYKPSGGAPVYVVKLKRASGTAKDGVWKGSVPVKLATSLGKWSIRAAARDAAGNSTGNTAVLDTFSLKRHVAMNNWQADRACANDCRTEVAGKVVVGVSLASAGSAEYASLPGQVVHIEWRKKGSSTWTKLGPPPGIDGGIYYGDMRSPGDGFWRARYYGTSTLAGNLTKEIWVDTK